MSLNFKNIDNFSKKMEKLAFEHSVCIDYDNVEIEGIKFEFRKGLLEDVRFKDGVWFGWFTGDKGFRIIMINPTKKELNEKRKSETHAYVSFNINQEKTEAQDLETGSLISLEECQSKRKNKIKVRTVCPNCKVQYSYVGQTEMANGTLKTDFFRCKKGVWCCKNVVNISVLKIQNTKDREIKENEEREENKKEYKSTVFLGGEKRILKDGKVFDLNGEITNELVYYREFYIRNWDIIINTLSFKKHYIIKSYDVKTQTYKAEAINSTTDMLSIIENHLGVVAEQIKKKSKSFKALIDVNIEMIDVLKNNVALWKILESSKSYNENMKVILDYKKGAI